jgi:radical SAM peptide maturase (CXXX-repeat target family)
LDKRTIEVTFQVTEGCSLACKYCYQHDKSPKRMSLETGKAFIDMLFRELKDSHYAVILEFIGGEPLLEPVLISQLVDYWYYKCIMENLQWGKVSRFSICSNGTEWDKPEVQALIHKLGNSLSFTVSIDGNKELHDSARVHPDGRGSYDEAIHAANDYERQYPQYKIGSKMTIAPSNIMFVYPALKHYLNSGADEIFANCVFEEGWTYEHATLLYNEMKKVADYKLENYIDTYISFFEEDMFEPMEPSDNQNWCGGTGLMLACDPDGKLYPCLRYMPSSVGRDRDDYVTMGTVETGIDREKLADMQKVTRRSQSTDECFYCPIARGCAWCSAYNWESQGSYNKRATYICPMHKARALINVYYWNKFYRIKGEKKRMKNYCPKEWALQIISEEEYEMLNKLAEE